MVMNYNKIYNVIFIILGSLIISGSFCNCSVSSGEVVKAGESEKIPILVICPPGPVIDPALGEDISVPDFDIFTDPHFVEEADNNIIVIETDVHNVSIYLNNVFMGNSNITITDLIPGQYILELKKKDYDDQRYFINVNKNRKNYYRFNFK